MKMSTEGAKGLVTGVAGGVLATATMDAAKVPAARMAPGALVSYRPAATAAAR